MINRATNVSSTFQWLFKLQAPSPYSLFIDPTSCVHGPTSFLCTARCRWQSSFGVSCFTVIRYENCPNLAQSIRPDCVGAVDRRCCRFVTSWTESVAVDDAENVHYTARWRCRSSTISDRVVETRVELSEWPGDAKEKEQRSKVNRINSADVASF